MRKSSAFYTRLLGKLMMHPALMTNVHIHIQTLSHPLARTRYLRCVPRLGVVLLVLALFGFSVGALYAQNANQPPNYFLSLITRQISIDGRNIEVTFRITNTGGNSTRTTNAELVSLTADATPPPVVARQEVPPLAANATQDVTFSVPVEDYPKGSQQLFQIQIIGLVGQPSITSIPISFSIEIPLTSPTPSTQTPPPNETGTAPTTSPTPAPLPRVRLPFVNLEVDLNNRQQVALVVGIVASGLLLIVLIFRLLRLLLQRHPDFRAVWQPPYATVPPLDPYTAAGIRQSWQPHAQNNLIMAAPTPGTFHVIKLLLGANGQYLSGWNMVALRLIQYDQYGRVTRSETLASAQMIQRLNRLMDRTGKLPRERLSRRVRGIAQRLTKQFMKKVSPRSAVLPIALDIRFRGVHGEVSILFELYRCDQGMWTLADRWQPEMMIAGRTLLESYTYSLYGQTGGETMRDFKRRLPDDLTRMLVELIGAKPAPLTSPTVGTSNVSPQPPDYTAPPTGTNKK